MTYRHDPLRTIQKTALTLEEHRALEAQRGRPLTDRPIGGTTAGKRGNDAAASAAISAVNGSSTEEADAVAEIVKQRRIAALEAARVVKVCGTVEGFTRHVGRNEWPCNPCRRAKREDSAT